MSRVSRSISSLMSYSLFLIAILLLSSARAAGADTKCDPDDYILPDEQVYSACDDTQRAIEEYTETCFRDMTTGDLRRMVDVCFMCGLYNDENCLRYFDEYKNTYKTGYSRVDFLEAIHKSDESAVLEQVKLLEKANAPRDFQRTLRVMAAGYVHYGDAQKAAQILEHCLQRDPNYSGCAADLSGVYLAGGNFEQAEYYANHARAMDPGNPAPDLIMAEIACRLGDMDRAREYLMQARDCDCIQGQAPFTEAKLLLAGGDFHGAYEAFAQVHGAYVFTWVFGDNHWLRDTAKLYMEIYDQSGRTMPDISELEQTAQTLIEQEKYYEAAMYYYLCHLIDPGDAHSLYRTAFMLEQAGEIELAVKDYSIYLALNPDAEEKQDIAAFLKSRETTTFVPDVSCSFFRDINTCNNAGKDCYWNNGDSECYEKSRPCRYYDTGDSCDSAPNVAECYWNIGMSRCIRRNTSCYSYDTHSSCDNAPTDRDCIWIESGNMCVRAFR